MYLFVKLPVNQKFSIVAKGFQTVQVGMFDNLCNNNVLVHVLKVSMTNQDNFKKRKKKNY